MMVLPDVNQPLLEKSLMQVTSTIAPIQTLSSKWVACGIFEGEPAPADVPGGEIVAGLLESKDLTGALGQTVPLHGSGLDGGSILIFGLGKKAKFSGGAAFAAGVSVAKKLSAKPREKVTVVLPQPEFDAANISSLVEGLIVGTAGPGIRKKEATRSGFGTLEIVLPPGGSLDAEALNLAVERGEIVGQAVNLARELVNTPPSEKPPAILAERARAIALEAGLAVEVWDRDRLAAERFGGVLAVSRGFGASRRDSCNCITAMGGDRPTMALVGKGVTFDSGGLSLKPSASMEDMKCDMAGAAVVLAAMQAIVARSCP